MLRVFTLVNGEYIRTKTGISIRKEQLSELVELLQVVLGNNNNPAAVG